MYEKRLGTEGFDIALNEKNAKHRRDKNYWTENRKHKSLRYDYPPRRKGVMDRRCVYLQIRSSNGRSHRRSAMSPFEQR